MIEAAEADAPAPRKKGGKLKKLILFFGLPLILVGGGAGAGLYAAGMMGGGKHAEEVDPHRPKLVLKGEGEEGGGTEDVKGPEPRTLDAHKYKATYYPMEQAFTSNLSDSDGFVQVGLGVSTYYDQKVIDNLTRSDMPVRSAVLDVLAQQDSVTMNSTEGKRKLRGELKDAINKVLRAKEGWGGVDDVYFTSFVVQ